MDNVKMILVDTVNCEVKEVVPKSWKEYHDYLKCELFDITRRTIGDKQYEIICDDIGLFKENSIISAINKKNEMMFVGNILIAGLVDAVGDLTSITDEDVKNITDNIVHMIDFNRGELTPILKCEY